MTHVHVIQHSFANTLWVQISTEFILSSGFLLTMEQHHYDDDECPITLEPLGRLPYPAFALSSAASNNTKHYFDGAALATYIISQGTFTNPLSLDEYLDEYCTGSELYPHRISVREAWSLRESIKVNVAGGDAHQRQREEVLRNEASVALRGLFVFGHERR